MIVKAGTYTAHIVEYGLPQAKTGKAPCCTVTFEFLEDDQKRRLTWFGYLSEAAEDKTLEQLLRCGLRTDDITSLLSPGALDFTKDLSIVVIHDEYNGETRAKIAWINELGGMKFEQMAKDQAAAQFRGLTQKIKAKRMEMGAGMPRAAKRAPAMQATGTSDFAPSEDNFDIE